MNLQEINKLREEIERKRREVLDRFESNNYGEMIAFLEEIQSSENCKAGKISAELIKKICNYTSDNIDNHVPIWGFLSITRSIIISKYYGNNGLNEYTITSIIDQNPSSLENAEQTLISKSFEFVESEFSWKNGIDIGGYRNKIFEAVGIDDKNGMKMLDTAKWVRNVYSTFEFYLSDNFYNGFIGEKELRWLIELNVIPAEKKKYFYDVFLALFKSKNYSRGLIKDEYLIEIYKIAFKGSCDYKDIVDSILYYLLTDRAETFENDKSIMPVFDLLYTNGSSNHHFQRLIHTSNYKEGLIPYEWLRMFIMPEFREVYESLFGLFVKDNYRKGLITKEQINQVLSYLRRIVYFSIKSTSSWSVRHYYEVLFARIARFLYSDLYGSLIVDGKIDFEKDIKFLLNENYEVFVFIISIICTEFKNNPEIWRNYLLKLLEMPVEEKKELCSEYIQYINKYKNSEENSCEWHAVEFARDYIASYGPYEMQKSGAKNNTRKW